MAEIKIEKKKGIPVWAMLLGLILLALIIWAVVEMGDDERPADVAGDTAAILLSAPAEALPIGSLFLELAELPAAA